MRLLPAAALLLAATTSLAQAATKHEVLEPKVIVVAGWENGADSGDAPGEYQFWVERHHLTETVPVRGIPGTILRRNQDGLYGLVLRHETLDLTALALDPHFDLRHTYWIFTGISGVNPNQASVGSVAWARWVVDGDALREVDDRSIPRDWPYGLYAIGADRPDQLPQDPNHYGSVTDVAALTRAYPLSQSLEHWAYTVSHNTPLADSPALATHRAAWKGYPAATQPPAILEGETLGALRYWHGKERNKWAEDWVALWTHGQGRFIMTNEESQTNQRTMRLLATFGYVDASRIMVLRAASNYSMPAPGASLTKSMGDEEYGQLSAFDNNERAGAPVIRELITHWDRYRDTPPTAD